MSEEKKKDKSFLDIIFEFIFKGAREDVKVVESQEVRERADDGMAKSFLDIIFEFIFKGARGDTKVVESQKVRKGADDSMAKGLSEVAKRPGVHANGEALNAVSKALNTPANSKESVKAEKNAAKQLNLLRVPGTAIDQGVGAVVAKATGASSEEAVKIGAVLGNDTMSREQRDSQARSSMSKSVAYALAESKKLKYDEANKLAQTFASVLQSSDIDFSNIKTTSEKVKVQKILGKKLKNFGFEDQYQVDELLEDYISKAELASKGKTSKGNWTLGPVDKGVPEVAESSPIKRILGRKSVDKSGSASSMLIDLKIKELESNDKFLSSVGIEENDLRRKRLKDEVRLLKIWQMSDKPEMQMSRNWGSMRQSMSVLNAVSSERNIFGGILNTETFDPKKNTLAPSKRKNLVVNGMKFDNMLVPKDENNPIDRKIVSYYYLTPVSMAKTLFVNGEGFVHSAYAKQRKMREIIANSESLYEFVENYEGDEFSKLLGDTKIPNNQKKVLEALAAEDKYTQLLEILQRNRSRILTDPNMAKVFGQLERLNKEIKTSSLLNYSYKLRDLTQKYSPSAILKKFVSAGLIAILGKKVGENAILGLHKLVMGIRRSVGRLVGRVFAFKTMNTFMNSFILAGTAIVYFFGDKLLKSFFKATAVFSWVLLIVLLILVFADSTWVARRFNTAANAPPIMPEYIEMCAGSGIPLDASVEESSRSEDLDSSVGRGGGMEEGQEHEQAVSLTCPLHVNQNLRCTQGPYNLLSHRNINAVDIVGPPPTDWLAPSDGIVTRSIWTYENPRLKGQLCGGIVNFYSPQEGVTYVLVHVTPYVQQNERVKQGEPVAKMAFRSDGNIHYRSFREFPTTCADGSHFHIEIRDTEVYADRYHREILNCDLGPCP